MGYIKHHAILVTGSGNLDIAREKAIELGNNVSDIVGPFVNGYSSFMVAPDGSKEGWETSHEGDSNRNDFIRWLRRQQYEDGISLYEWIEISYGSDDRCATITNHAWEGGPFYEY